MAVDISQKLWAAYQHKGEWSRTPAWFAALHIGIKTDKDDNWISFLDNQGLLGFLSMRYPVLFATRILQSIVWPYPIQVVPITSVDSPELACDDEVLSKIFGHPVDRRSLGEDPFMPRDFLVSAI